MSVTQGLLVRFGALDVVASQAPHLNHDSRTPGPRAEGPPQKCVDYRLTQPERRRRRGP